MRWHKSLYWRIAMAVLFLAAMLVVQAMLFVWSSHDRGAQCLDNRPGVSRKRLRSISPMLWDASPISMWLGTCAISTRRIRIRSSSCSPTAG